MSDASKLPAASSEKASPTKKPRPKGAKLTKLTVGGDVRAIVPRNMDEALRLAKAISLADMVPDSFVVIVDNDESQIDWMRTNARTALAIMKGMEVGLPPITAVSSICFVNNRPSLWGDAAMALVQSSGQLEWYDERLEGEPGTNEWTAHCVVKRRGQREPYKRSFSMQDAERAGLKSKSGPWKEYPQRMLQMRARAWALRDGFADCLAGLSIAEEMQDVPPSTAAKIDLSFLDDDLPGVHTHSTLSPEVSPAAHNIGEGEDVPDGCGSDSGTRCDSGSLPDVFVLIRPDGSEKVCEDAEAWVALYQYFIDQGMAADDATRFLCSNATTASWIARDHEPLGKAIFAWQEKLQVTRHRPSSMPARRKPPRLGVREVTHIRCEPHKKWVRGHMCLAEGLGNCSGKIQFAHVRSAKAIEAAFGIEVPKHERPDGSAGVDPSDCFGVPLCAHHHMSTQHSSGEETFWRMVGINPLKVAARLWFTSPAGRRYRARMEKAE